MHLRAEQPMSLLNSPPFLSVFTSLVHGEKCLDVTHNSCWCWFFGWNAQVQELDKQKKEKEERQRMLKQKREERLQKKMTSALARPSYSEKKHLARENWIKLRFLTHFYRLKKFPYSFYECIKINALKLQNNPVGNIDLVNYMRFDGRRVELTSTYLVPCTRCRGSSRIPCASKSEVIWVAGGQCDQWMYKCMQNFLRSNRRYEGYWTAQNNQSKPKSPRVVIFQEPHWSTNFLIPGRVTINSRIFWTPMSQSHFIAHTQFWEMYLFPQLTPK